MNMFKHFYCFCLLAKNSLSNCATIYYMKTSIQLHGNYVLLKLNGDNHYATVFLLELNMLLFSLYQT